MAINYDPTNGEKSIATLPEYGGTGGGQQAAEFYAARDFAKQFSRNPTQSELSMLAPAYIGSDPNVANLAQGKGAVSQYFQTYANNPQDIAASQNAQYLKDAPQHYDDINNVFQSQLGRAATQDELDHFGSLLASGTTDKYGLQTFLQQQPEYQTTKNKNFQNDLSTQLSGYDSDYFKSNILPALQEAYAKQGRSFDSSAFQGAATNSAQQQNVQRQQYIAGLSAQQYGNVESNAYNDYAAQVANQNALTNAGINAKYTGVQNLNDRINSFTDYNTQSQAYNQYLAKYGKRSNPLLGGLQGALSGAAAGGSVGGPWGALAGAVGGGALGAYGSSKGGGF